ncbi:immunity 50 family protein [Burkholderia ambifaria]|uniref:immunity 50 family protein n=1 Tax=Burkholderia ambifaria TaxID=152480 RepID=UPI00158B462C|nr:immunity 50 family protein [Burkholderia ambifaria]MBR8347520.1 immunity 50 family protein [Burkholderia ambifaria]
MNTTTKVMNPQAITSIYGEFPSLIGAELTEVRVARDEPRISVRFATERRPIKHPVRWPQNYDEIYIGISFIGVCDFSFFQWGQKNIVEEVDLKDIDDRVSVRFSCKNHVALKFLCDWIRIEGVAWGYVGSH